MKGLLLAVLLSIGVGSALHAARTLAHDPGSDGCEGLAQIQQRSGEFEQQRQQRASFAIELDAILDRFACSTSSLAETVADIESEAIAHYPHYLTYLVVVEHGETTEERIAYNVVRFFHARHFRTPSPGHAAQLEHCRQQLRSFLGHEPDAFLAPGQCSSTAGVAH